MARMTLTEILKDPMINVNLTTGVACTEDQRIVQGFEEINEFIDQHQRKPGETDRPSVAERGLQIRLEGLLVNTEKHLLLHVHDRHGLLVVAHA